MKPAFTSKILLALIALFLATAAMSEVKAAGLTGTVVLQQGGAVPGAGSDGIPAGAVWLSFGPPAIDDLGNIAVLGRWKAGAKTGEGIFVTASGVTTAVAVLGGDVPGINGGTYKTFLDPVISDGNVAFQATMAGVPAANASVILGDGPSGTLEVIAQSSQAAPGCNGALFASFQNIAADGDSVAFQGKLKSGKTTASKVSVNINAMWLTSSTVPLQLMLRQGQRLEANGPTIGAFTAFKAGVGSDGQGRGWLTSGVMALAPLSNTNQAIVFSQPAIGGGGALVTFTSTLAMTRQTGTGGPTLPGGSFVNPLGLPTINELGHVALSAVLKTGNNSITSANAKGIFCNYGSGAYTPVARMGDTATGTLGKFAAFKDPLLTDSDGVAFEATLTAPVPTAQRDSIWWQASSSDPLELAAQAGVQAPGVGTGALWKAFTSVAVTPNGPLFEATLTTGKGGVTSANSMGVWAVDSSGDTTLIIQTGESLNGKTVKTFSLLGATVGSTGVTRSFSSATVTWLATFTDKTTAVVTTPVP